MATTKTEVLTVLVIDAQTGEVFERPLTEQELEYRKQLQAENTLKETQLKEKESARQSALAKLKELGLTEAEIAAL